MMRYVRDAFLIIGVSASLVATADAFHNLGSHSGDGRNGRSTSTPVVVDASVSVARACEAMTGHLGRDAPRMASVSDPRGGTGERILPLACRATGSRSAVDHPLGPRPHTLRRD